MKQFLLYATILFQLGLIISLVRGIQLSLRSKERITALQTTKQKLEAEQSRLSADEEYVKSAYYLEKVAREELHLAKPGETVVIIPEGKIVESKEQRTENIEQSKPNWQQWWEILSGKRE